MVIIVYIVGLVWFLWALYVLVMGIYRAHLAQRMGVIDYLLAAPWVALGVVVDVAVNVALASVVFWDLPREWLLTQRLKRYVASEYGWRYRAAKYICDRRLDLFDPGGDHC